MRRIFIGMLLTTFIIFTLGLSTGCARRAKPVTATFPAEPEPAMKATPMPEEGTEEKLGEGMSSEFEEGDLALRQSEEGRELLFAQAGQELKTIYFAFDSSALTPESKASLEQAAKWLKEHPEVNIRIEGNCDERGTNEYNLALGERRALAARRYLISLGIGDDRIFTISYGEERPAVEGHDESAWKFNRRDDFKVSPM